MLIACCASLCLLAHLPVSAILDALLRVRNAGGWLVEPVGGAMTSRCNLLQEHLVELSKTKLLRTFGFEHTCATVVFRVPGETLSPKVYPELSGDSFPASELWGELSIPISHVL